MRLSIKKHNQAYVRRIASQMECDPATALDYLLFELRKMNYSFGSFPTALQNPVMREAMPEVNFKSPQAISQFEELQQIQQEEIDPIIERLVLAGLESF